MTDVLAADIEVFTEEVGDPRRTTLRHMLDDVLHGESAVLWLGRCSQAAVLAWLGRTLLVITVATVVAVVVIFLGAALARAWLSWTWLASWGRRWLTGSWRSWSWLAGSWCWRWLVTSRGWSRRRWCSSRSWRVGIRCSWGWRGRRSCGCIRGARGALGWLTSFPLWSSFRRSTLTLPLAASITESSTDREVLARELLIAHSVPLLALLGEKGTERGELARGRATIVTDELTAESSSIREQGDEAWHGTDSLEGGVGDGSGESESSEGLHLE